MTHPNDPAFKSDCEERLDDRDAFIPSHGHRIMCGLTKREWFTGMALQGILAGKFVDALSAIHRNSGKELFEAELVVCAVRIAQEAIRQLDRKEKE